MPGVGLEHGRAQAACGREREAEQPLFGEQGDQRHDQRSRMQRRQCVHVLQAHARAPQEADAHPREHRAQHEGGRGLDATVAVGMVRVGGVGALAPCHQHEQVGDQVGQRVRRVCHQAEGIGEQADDDLPHGQGRVGDDGDQGGALDAFSARAVIMLEFAGCGGAGGSLGGV